MAASEKLTILVMEGYHFPINHCFALKRMDFIDIKELSLLLKIFKNALTSSETWSFWMRGYLCVPEPHESTIVKSL